MSSSPEQTSVVIIGGSLVGLSAAMLLAWHNVPCILLEKREESTLHPRAVGYTPRTMEIFDSVGVADQIPQVEKGFKLQRVKVESMTGKWHEHAMPWKPENKNKHPTVEEHKQFTPFMGAALAQDRLEPILREKAKSLGADIRMGARVTKFEQDDTKVSVSVTDQDGLNHQIEASYMIAADGHRSDTRQTLGISTSGRGYLNTVRSVLFRAKLNEYMKGYQQFAIRQAGLEAFLTTYGDNRWVLMFTDDVERTDEEQRTAICRAVGIEDLEFEIITTGIWELKANIADTFQVGRVFLAGDAAHTLPPTRGGYGANTGIHDVHNLTWKLAAVLQGTCRPKILGTYSPERRPVAWLRHQQTFARPDYAQYRQSSDDETQIYEDSAIELGQIYASDAISDDEADSALEPLARPPDEWRGRPGTRAPYRVLKLWDGGEISSLKLFGRDWMLMTEDQTWVDKALKVCRDARLKVKCVVMNESSCYSNGRDFCCALGLDKGGASLIRPDGHIAWRSKESSANGGKSLVSYINTVAAG